MRSMHALTNSLLYTTLISSTVTLHQRTYKLCFVCFPMANGNTPLWVAVSIVALMLGAILGAYLFPTTVEVVKTETQLKVVEVPVASETKYEVDSNPSDRAVEALLKEIDENEDLWECGDRDYDQTQISVIRVRDTETSSKYSDDTGEYTVVLDARLKYTDGEHQCYDNVDVTVEYDNDREEPHIEVD